MTVTAVLRKKEMAVLRCRNPASNLCSLIDSCSLTLTHSLTHAPNKSDSLFIPAACPSSPNSVSIYSVSAASTTSTQVLPFLISSPYAANERKLGGLSDELRSHALWYVYFFTSFCLSFFLSFISPSFIAFFHTFCLPFTVFFPSNFSASLLCSRLFPILIYLFFHVFTFLLLVVISSASSNFSFLAFWQFSFPSPYNGSVY